MKTDRRWLIAAMAWMALIAFLSSIPKPDGDPGIGSWDKLAHLSAYAVLGFLLARTLFPDGIRFRIQIAAVTALATLYGVSDEFHQSFVPGRESSIGDLAADAGGALLAACLLYWLRTRRVMAGHGGAQ